mgnify:CR=1 FL=1
MIKNDVPLRGFLSLSFTASQVYMFHPELLSKKLSPELYNVCKTVENEIDIFDTPQSNGDELHYNQKYTSDRIARKTKCIWLIPMSKSKSKYYVVVTCS